MRHQHAKRKLRDDAPNILPVSCTELVHAVTSRGIRCLELLLRDVEPCVVLRLIGEGREVGCDTVCGDCVQRVVNLDTKAGQQMYGNAEQMDQSACERVEWEREAVIEEVGQQRDNGRRLGLRAPLEGDGLHDDEDSGVAESTALALQLLVLCARLQSAEHLLLNVRMRTFFIGFARCFMTVSIYERVVAATHLAVSCRFVGDGCVGSERRRVSVHPVGIDEDVAIEKLRRSDSQLIGGQRQELVGNLDVQQNPHLVARPERRSLCSHLQRKLVAAGAG